MPASVLLPAFELTQQAGYLTGDPTGWHATESARLEWDVFVTELKSWLLERLRTTPDTEADDARLLDEALGRMVSRILSEESSSMLRAEDHALAV